jgi:hypothetical protein
MTPSEKKLFVEIHKIRMEEEKELMEIQKSKQKM